MVGGEGQGPGGRPGRREGRGLASGESPAALVRPETGEAISKAQKTPCPEEVLLERRQGARLCFPPSDSQTPSRAPLPPAPRLSVLPPGQPFSQGQQVWLQCSPPEGRRPAGFLYYRKRAGGWSEPSTLEGSPLEVSTTDLEQEETFACAYWEVTLAGGQAQSEQSNTVQLSVRGEKRFLCQLIPRHVKAPRTKPQD